MSKPKILISVSFEKFLCGLSAARRSSQRIADATCTVDELLERYGKMRSEQHKESRYFLVTEDNKVVGGFAVIQGELVALFSRVRGLGHWLLRNAVAAGAFRLNCFDGYLSELYKNHGFVIYARARNYTPGGPDVVYMRIP